MAELAVGAILTASDPQPPVGTRARDDMGRRWQLDDDQAPWPADWTRLDGVDDPESWVKVAGNYGPVTVVRVGYGDG